MFTLHLVKLAYKKRTILQNVKIELSKGECVGLTGKNGSGKTSLIRAIADITPYEGEMFLDGVKIKETDYKYKKELGFLLRLEGFYSLDITIKEHFDLIFSLYQCKPYPYGELKTHCDNLEIYLDNPIHLYDYSDGMKQKVLFLSAIMHTPKYVFLDEPFNFMDTDSIQYCSSLIKDMLHKHTGVLMVTHSQEIITQLCNHTIDLDTLSV